MARLARVVISGVPHHVTQRGNRREPIFFEDGDQEVYRDLLAEQARRRGVEVWAYCLMPNHVHLIMVPRDEAGLGLAVGEAHRRYTNFVNARGRWTGHLFQSRFGPVAMDDDHLMAAARYVPMNPVRARLVAQAAQWPWSSARAHLAGRDDGLAVVGPLLDRIGDFAAFLAEEEDAPRVAALRSAETVGRPLGNETFIQGLEQLLGRRLARGRPGPHPRSPPLPQADLWG